MIEVEEYLADEKATHSHKCYPKNRYPLNGLLLHGKSLEKASYNKDEECLYPIMEDNDGGALDKSAGSH